jgi:hypothetical protein
MSLTAVAAAAPDTQQVAEQDEYMDEITAEVAMPPELVSFMQKVEKVRRRCCMGNSNSRQSSHPRGVVQQAGVAGVVHKW